MAVITAEKRELPAEVFLPLTESSTILMKRMAGCIETQKLRNPTEPAILQRKTERQSKQKIMPGRNGRADVIMSKTANFWKVPWRKSEMPTMPSIIMAVCTMKMMVISAFPSMTKMAITKVKAITVRRQEALFIPIAGSKRMTTERIIRQTEKPAQTEFIQLPEKSIHFRISICRRNGLSMDQMEPAISQMKKVC